MTIETPSNSSNPMGEVQETNVWAIVSLISGVLAWVGVCGLGGVGAVICGHVAN
ncbi:MAG: hypothetical protein IH586_08225, partial [Anaerolineaceae bacterium]|nr:hypothetical protein [Anaerolineaceae bacterium]